MIFQLMHIRRCYVEHSSEILHELGCFTYKINDFLFISYSEVVEKVKEEIADVSPDKIFAVVHISKSLGFYFSLKNDLLFCIGGRQFKITQNDLIVINRIPADVGESIFLQKVLHYHTPMYHCLYHNEKH